VEFDGEWVISCWIVDVDVGGSEADADADAPAAAESAINVDMENGHGAREKQHDTTHPQPYMSPFPSSRTR
jgi:hypothetical protein